MLPMYNSLANSNDDQMTVGPNYGAHASKECRSVDGGSPKIRQIGNRMMGSGYLLLRQPPQVASPAPPPGSLARVIGHLIRRSERPAWGERCWIGLGLVPAGLNSQSKREPNHHPEPIEQESSRRADDNWLEIDRRGDLRCRPLHH